MSIPAYSPHIIVLSRSASWPNGPCDGSLSPVISELTLVELTSAISRKIREQTLSREEGARLLTQIDAHVEEGYYRVVPVRPCDYRVARAWLSQLQGTLRTLDALHLAVAESAEASTLTADKRLAAEARSLGMPVKLLTIHRRR